LPAAAICLSAQCITPSAMRTARRYSRCFTELSVPGYRVKKA
jgi:hypothetical protein